jgi:hypothetical protein
LRDIAGYPVPGTTGLSLPAFNDKWLELWAGMVAPKIEAWERERKRAEDEEACPLKAKL